MILGIGNDIVDIERIKRTVDRYGLRFENRCFTSYECQKASTRKEAGTHYHFFAKRFAAKEALVKALGTGFVKDIIFKDICIKEDGQGRPLLELKGGALKQLQSMTPKGMKPVLHLSLSDEPPFAQAFVVIEAV